MKKKYKVSGTKLKVKNVSGTKEQSCACRSWIRHWKRYSKKPGEKCSVATCASTGTILGGHVRRAKSKKDQKIFIVPLCDACNNDGGTLTLRSKTRRVFADIAECRIH